MIFFSFNPNRSLGFMVSNHFLHGLLTQSAHVCSLGILGDLDQR